MVLAHEQVVKERYFFFSNVQMVQVKVNLNLSLPVYSLISTSNENIMMEI